MSWNNRKETTKFQNEIKKMVVYWKSNDKYKKSPGTVDDEIPPNSYPFEQEINAKNFPDSEKRDRRYHDAKIHNTH